MQNYYEVTKIVNPCDLCKGEKFIERDESYWSSFQKEFVKVFEGSEKPLDSDALEQIKAKMPKFPALETCQRCKGDGRYEKKISLRDAMIEILGDDNFERTIQSNREYKRQMEEDIPY